ncbi:uncharacterized protein LOC112093843 [Morus notabilis]|uniref:uncharacterized protein LOC112093843 n=1 Tax=Morus notabilis TaxID=981085 RepID=UPI000CED51B0|nr:uncharacterized protein LOC112093843 [Morus notabilis]
MEVYVDDMLVKSKKSKDYVEDLKGMFDILRKYRMKLNPLKCAFKVKLGKFLGFMVSSRGIEANPEKVQTLLDIKSPQKLKEVNKLMDCIVVLNRFILKSTDKCISFFDTLRGSKPFQWTEECEHAFQQLKEHIRKPPLLSKPTTGEVLSLYLAVSEHVVSSVLVLQKPDTFGRLLKWSIELSQFDIDYKPRIAIKGQALVDFVAEFMGLPNEAEVVGGPLSWKLYVDGSSNDNGSGAELVLHTPEGHKVTSAVRFEFPTSNNKAEYEVLLARLRLAEHLKVEAIDISSDSQLVVNQVKGQYQTRDEKMAAYLEKVKEALEKLTAYDIQQVPRAENSNADALPRLATSKDAELLKLVPVEVLKDPSTEGKLEVMSMSHQPSWKDPIIRYLLDGELPEDKQQAKRLRYQASRFTMHDVILYRRGFSTPLLRCLDEEEAKRVLSKSNGQVEVVNKIIKVTLKRRLNSYKGKLADEVPKVLWAYRTTSRTTTGETPCSMAYGVEVVLPVEISIPTSRVTQYEENRNAKQMGLELDLLEERCITG